MIKVYIVLINKHLPPTHKYRKYSTETLLKLATHVCPTSNEKLVHIAKEYQISQ